MPGLRGGCGGLSIGGTVGAARPTYTGLPLYIVCTHLTFLPQVVEGTEYQLRLTVTCERRNRTDGATVEVTGVVDALVALPANDVPSVRGMIHRAGGCGGWRLQAVSGGHWADGVACGSCLL